MSYNQSQEVSKFSSSSKMLQAKKFKTNKTTYKTYSICRIPKTGDYGQSIHKFCCRSRPHCPKEFFHNLRFPPSAEGVVRDFYDQEIGSYNFATGEKKAQQYTRIQHFANIVWKKTTKIGCAQSNISTANGCVYTVVQYKLEGSVGGPEVFKDNIGDLSKS